jgi:EmrB/QacA subfamily drug resistance transporter
MTSTVVQNSRSRQFALAALCTGMLMIVLDQTITNVALPSIQRDLGFSQANLAWVVNTYLIAFGGLLLLAGRLGDLIGRKRMFLIGLGVFTTASLLCGLSFSQPILVAARFIQGAGGAMSSGVILGMIVTMFRDPAEQARALGVYSFVASAGGSIGLIAGGILTQALNWHWIFLVNVPIGVAAAILAGRLLEPERGLGLGSGADAPGAALVTGSLMIGIYAIVETAAYGWGSPHTLGFGALAVVLLAAFIARQATARNPLLPLRLLRSRRAGANAVQAFMVAGMLGTFFLGALYLQRVLGYPPLAIGLAFLPTGLAISVLSLRIAPTLMVHFGAKRVLLAGLLLMVAGMAWLARVPVAGQYVVDILPAVLPIGAGMGLSFPPLMALAMVGVQPADAGLASGLANATGQVGGALGLAVLATLATGRTEQFLASGLNTATALTGGYQFAFGLSAALVAVGGLLGALVLRSSAPKASPSPATDAPFVAPGCSGAAQRWHVRAGRSLG